MSWQCPSWLGRRKPVPAALERVPGRLQELLDRVPHSEQRELLNRLLNNKVVDVVGYLSRVAAVVGNT